MLFAANHQLLLIHSNSLALLTGAFAVRKSLHIYRVPYYQDLHHAQLLLPWATFATLPPCNRPFTRPFPFVSCPIRLTGSTPDSLSYGVIFRTTPFFPPKSTPHIFCVGQQQLCLFALQSTYRVVAEPSSLRCSQICVDTGIRKGTFRPATTVSSNGRVINKYAVDFGHSHQPTHDH